MILITYCNYFLLKYCHWVMSVFVNFVGARYNTLILLANEENQSGLNT